VQAELEQRQQRNPTPSDQQQPAGVEQLSPPILSPRSKPRLRKFPVPDFLLSFFLVPPFSAPVLAKPQFNPIHSNLLAHNFHVRFAAADWDLDETILRLLSITLITQHDHCRNQLMGRVFQISEELFLQIYFKVCRSQS
jgi:hypothetical protein